jgi:hypothetical protein
VLAASSNVRIRGLSGGHMLAASFSQLDPNADKTLTRLKKRRQFDLSKRAESLTRLPIVYPSTNNECKLKLPRADPTAFNPKGA